MTAYTNPSVFSPLSTVLDKESGDYCQLSLLENIVTFRTQQVMDASPCELGLTVEDIHQNSPLLAEWEQIRAMVATAYRLGLKDGLVRLGEAE